MKILQNTSIGGFREAFLLRKGKLKFEPNQIIIIVEESGVDILLNKIPWGFRYFKLPWQAKTYITEWY